MTMTPELATRFAAFVLRWHGLPRRRAGVEGLRRSLDQLQGLSLPFSELESSILAGRVRDYSSPMLDRLVRDGEILWQGDRALGEHDGWLSLYAADRFAALGRIGLFAAGHRPQAIRELLLHHGRLEFECIRERLGGFGDDLLRALWQLVWSGEASSDSLDAWRARLSSTATRYHGGRRPRYARRRRVLPGAAGHWRLLSGPGHGFAAEAERRLSRAACELDRWGIVTRVMTPGYDALRPLLDELEARGLARRTRLLTASDGDEFSTPEAEQTWHACRDDSVPVVLAATDPANPFGERLPWPTMASRNRPRRAPGARVLMQGGCLIACLSADGRHLHTPDAGADAAALVRLLREAAMQGPLYLETVDGQGPGRTSWHDTLLAAGFSPSPRAYLLRAGAGRFSPDPATA